MNRDDKKLYIRLFVDFIKEGTKVTPDEAETDFILTRIPETFLNNFADWLKCMSNRYEDEDEFYKWYDNVQFEDISDTEIKQYNMPSKKKTIYFNWDTKLILGLYELAKQFVNDAQKLPLYDANIVVGYKFTNYGLEVFYFAPKGTELNKACSKNGYDLKVRKEVYELYKKLFAGSHGSEDYKGEAQLLKDKYKPICDELGICIGENTAEISAKAGENDEDYYTGRWWGISYYEVKADEEFQHAFFENINDTYESKRRPDAK